MAEGNVISLSSFSSSFRIKLDQNGRTRRHSLRGHSHLPSRAKGGGPPDAKTLCPATAGIACIGCPERYVIVYKAAADISGPVTVGDGKMTPLGDCVAGVCELILMLSGFMVSGRTVPVVSSAKPLGKLYVSDKASFGILIPSICAIKTDLLSI